jgi:hypothetical protein
MHPPSALPRSMRFSSDSLPLRDRIAVWREFYGQQIMRVDIEPSRDLPFRADLKLRALPGLKTVSGTVGGMCYRRTPEMVSDGNDNVYLFMARSGATMMSHLGREVTVRGWGRCFSILRRFGYRIPASAGRPHRNPRATRCARSAGLKRGRHPRASPSAPFRGAGSSQKLSSHTR